MCRRTCADPDGRTLAFAGNATPFSTVDRRGTDHLRHREVETEAIGLAPGSSPAVASDCRTGRECLLRVGPMPPRRPQATAVGSLSGAGLRTAGWADFATRGTYLVSWPRPV